MPEVQPSLFGNAPLAPSDPSPAPSLLAHSNFKTRLCDNFAKFGSCVYGEKCSFAHGPHELRTPQTVPPPVVNHPYMQYVSSLASLPPYSTLSMPLFQGSPYAQPAQMSVMAPSGPSAPLPPKEGTLETYYPDLEGRKPENWVCIMGLHWWTTDEEIERTLSPIARPLSLSFVFDIPTSKSKGVVFIEFESSTAAAGVLDAFSSSPGRADGGAASNAHPSGPLATDEATDALYLGPSSHGGGASAPAQSSHSDKREANAGEEGGISAGPPRLAENGRPAAQEGVQSPGATPALAALGRNVRILPGDSEEARKFHAAYNPGALRRRMKPFSLSALGRSSNEQRADGGESLETEGEEVESKTVPVQSSDDFSDDYVALYEDAPALFAYARPAGSFAD